MTFEEARKAMLEQIILKTQTPPRPIKIFFSNDDIPEFLKKLDEFEANSREKSLLVR